MGSIDTSIREKLKYLANLPETDYPFISFYMHINSQENFLEQAEKNRIFIKDSFLKHGDKIKQEGDREKLTSFRADEERIKDYLEKNFETQNHGVAVFACDKLGVFEVFKTNILFENSFHIDSSPLLKQLAFQIDNNKNILAVMVDAKYSRIFNLELGGTALKEIDTEDRLHRFHKEGGWAQSRYQRHIENEVDFHFKNVAAIVIEFYDKERYSNIILIGQEQEVKNFQKNLPKRLNEKIITIDELQMRENINNIIATIKADADNDEKKKKLETVIDIINKTQDGRLETLGMQDTLQLAKEGRVRILAIAKDLVFDGYRCDGCYYVSKDQHYGNCPKCNGNLKETDLVEQAVRLTLKNGGEVEFAQNQAAAELEKYGGIGARLRY